MANVLTVAEVETLWNEIYLKSRKPQAAEDKEDSFLGDDLKSLEASSMGSSPRSRSNSISSVNSLKNEIADTDSALRQLAAPLPEDKDYRLVAARTSLDDLKKSLEYYKKEKAIADKKLSEERIITKEILDRLQMALINQAKPIEDQLREANRLKKENLQRENHKQLLDLLFQHINKYIYDYLAVKLKVNPDGLVSDFKDAQRDLIGIDDVNALKRLEACLASLRINEGWGTSPRTKIMSFYRKAMEEKLFTQQNPAAIVRDVKKIAVAPEFKKGEFNKQILLLASTIEDPIKNNAADQGMEDSFEELSVIQLEELCRLKSSAEAKGFISEEVTQLSHITDAFPEITALDGVASLIKTAKHQLDVSAKNQADLARQFKKADSQIMMLHSELGRARNTLSDARQKLREKISRYEARKQQLESHRLELSSQLTDAEDEIKESISFEKGKAHDLLKDAIREQVILAASRYLKHMASGARLEGWHFGSGRERATQLVNAVMQAQTLQDIVTALNNVLNTTRWYGGGAVLGKDSFNTFLLKELSRENNPRGIFSLAFIEDIHLNLNMNAWRGRKISQDDLRDLDLKNIPEPSGVKVQKISAATEDDRILIRNQVVHVLKKMVEWNPEVIPYSSPRIIRARTVSTATLTHSSSQLSVSSVESESKSPVSSRSAPNLRRGSVASVQQEVKRSSSMADVESMLGISPQTVVDNTSQELEFKQGKDYLNGLAKLHHKDIHYGAPLQWRSLKYVPVQGTALGVCDNGIICEFVFSSPEKPAVGVDWRISEAKIKKALGLSQEQHRGPGSDPQLAPDLSIRA